MLISHKQNNYDLTVYPLFSLTCSAVHVRLQHYSHIRTTLLWILEDFFQDDFTEEVKSAWEQIYDQTAEYMILGAQRK